jgi:hypothetical protein
MDTDEPIQKSRPLKTEGDFFSVNLVILLPAPAEARPLIFCMMTPGSSLWYLAGTGS